MRFPAGLSARLARHRVLRAFNRESAPAIFHLSPLVQHFPSEAHLENVSPETEWHSPRACLLAARQVGAPVVWLGGTEPLFHPAIGELAATLAESGHYVFLHTSGAGFRKRIHEFKPVPRLYLCFEIPAIEESAKPSLTAASNGAISFQTVAEGIRIARLSGFHICVHCTIGSARTPREIAARITQLRTYPLDGVVVSSQGSHSRASNDASSAGLLAQAMRLIPARRWRSFSRLLEISYQDHGVVSRQEASRSSREASACEESA
jgi:hypothetical protein